MREEQNCLCLKEGLRWALLTAGGPASKQDILNASQGAEEGELLCPQTLVPCWAHARSSPVVLRAPQTLRVNCSQCSRSYTSENGLFHSNLKTHPFAICQSVASIFSFSPGPELSILPAITSLWVACNFRFASLRWNT